MERRWRSLKRCFYRMKLATENRCDYFNYVLEHMNAQPEEVLFIDDSPANIEAAEALGINTFLFNLQEQDLAKNYPRSWQSSLTLPPVPLGCKKHTHLLSAPALGSLFERTLRLRDNAISALISSTA